MIDQFEGVSTNASPIKPVDQGVEFGSSWQVGQSQPQLTAIEALQGLTDAQHFSTFPQGSLRGQTC